MPNLARPISKGGVGFDYRFAMGIPDFWIKLTKDTPDEHWPMGHLWYELTNARTDEATISYAESHDQALVGDQTLMFRLMGDAIYHHMHVDDADLKTDRAMALHKLIRLVTLATAQGGYLNFMGNEFGHPEWIDFPREGNQWSYHYARRQWRLADDPGLKYHQLLRFDRDMLALARENDLFQHPPRLLHEHDGDKIMAFERAGSLWVFNFHPEASFTDYGFECPAGPYRLRFHSDEPRYGGHGRLHVDHLHRVPKSNRRIRLYLPNRAALVLSPSETP
jgi:1,4-alpha-glucan branching enzyme